MWSLFILSVLSFSAVVTGNADSTDQPSCKGNPGSPYCTLPLYHFHDNIKSAINKQVNREIDASLFYMELSSHFNRDDVNRKGFAKFFMKCSDEEREHSKLLTRYLNERDGYWTGYSNAPHSPMMNKPGPNDLVNGMTAVRFALLLEKEVSLKLTDLHKMAVKHNDLHLADMLESDMLREQVESVRELTGMLANLEAMYNDPRGVALAEWLYDQELLKKE